MTIVEIDVTPETVQADETTYCAVHPDRETGLRCNRCGRYMCAQCAVSTPVGYRCRECVREVENKFFSGTNTDNLIVGGAAAVATAAVVFLGLQVGILNMIIITFFAGVIYGGALSQLLLKVVSKRRGRYMGYAGAAGVLIGAFAGRIVYLLAAGIPLEMAFQLILSFGFGWLIFAGISAFVVYGRFR